VIVPLVLAVLAQAPDIGKRAAPTLPASRFPLPANRVDGQVVRGTRAGPVPLANQWVVLHRLVADRSKSGPIDSTRTDAKGRYTFRYSGALDSATMFFATTSHGGIVYPTSPFRSERVSGDDATLTVFDTTSGRVALKVGGRHLIVGAAQPNGNRPVGEVFDLENDSTVTAIARDSVTPIYAIHIPSAATNFRANGGGAFAGGAMSRSGSTVGLYAPVSPGLRQFAFTYDLPANAFPLTIAAESPIGVFEILVEDPKAEVRAPSLREMAPESMEGRTFRRFLAQDLAQGAVVRVNLPRIAIADRQRIYLVVALSLLGLMVVALIFAARRPRLVRVAPVIPPPVPEARSQTLARAIVELDDSFDAVTTTENARAEYESRRAALKAQLSDALAAERGST
jgi:hypothetical protein